MKTIELKNTGLAELGTQESTNLRGGFLPLVGAWLGIAIREIIEHPGQVKEGFLDCFN